MSGEEIEKARLKALEAVAEKHLAEKEKLLRENEELDKKLNKRFFDISLSSLLKTVIAGLVAGILIWSVGLDYVFKINKVNVELKQQILEDNKKLQVEKQSLKEELENTQRKLIDLSDKAAAAPNTERNSEFEAAIVKEVHRLEEQSSKIAVTEQTIMAPPPAIGLGKQGWVYLGEYTEGVWKTRYFDFGPAVKPAALIDRELRVAVHSVNVRTKKFSGDIFKALLKGQVVQIDKVEKYPFTNNMWALVRY